ncbi:MAG TPA: P-II family nitrogen regulator [Spirochaetia bacterium]|nr:MAG: hypothetical protein A2Y41_04375 [Spirochaetes bacterium GWB1_36_13]HCL55491.1 P-II family nitrogen regulator [Spirochaetia bacterium]
MWKKIEAIIRPYKIQKIITELEKLNVFFYLEDSKGFGKRLSPLSLYQSEKAPVIETLPRTKITILCPDAQVEPIVSIILEDGNTGIVGDGKIFIQTIEKIIDIYKQEING